MTALARACRTLAPWKGDQWNWPHTAFRFELLRDSSRVVGDSETIPSGHLAEKVWRSGQWLVGLQSKLSQPESAALIGSTLTQPSAITTEANQITEADSSVLFVLHGVNTRCHAKVCLPPS